MNKRNWLLASATAVLLAVAGCATTQAPVSVADTTARTPQLSTMSKLMADAGLTETLRGAGPYTVFAPSDDAFKAVPAKTMAELTQDKERLKAVLSYHVLPTKMTTAQVVNGKAKTVEGANVELARAGTFVTVEDALVTQADVQASNGVVHVIDRVLIPPKK
jgi:uncharacterized surface protein with fasciclin (FAS1) repeats